MRLFSAAVNELVYAIDCVFLLFFCVRTCDFFLVCFCVCVRARVCLCVCVLKAVRPSVSAVGVIGVG